MLNSRVKHPHQNRKELMSWRHDRTVGLERLRHILQNTLGVDKIESRYCMCTQSHNTNNLPPSRGEDISPLTFVS